MTGGAFRAISQAGETFWREFAAEPPSSSGHQILSTAGDPLSALLRTLAHAFKEHSAAICLHRA